MASTKIENSVIEGLDSSKLTGTFGTLDASSLTNLPTPGETIMRGASDPEVSTDPIHGVGTIFQNTTTGLLFCCLQAITDENIWKTVDAGETTTIEPNYWSYTGTVSAHTFGGYIAHYGTDMLKKWNFASNTTASSKGSISGAGGRGTDGPMGVSSSTHGYVCGGHSADTGGTVSKISKVASATESENSVNTGAHLSTARYMGAATGSETSGYVISGSPTTTVIDKFNFASDGSCSAVANQGVPSYATHGNSSQTHGYISSGQDWTTGALITTIQKFPFASDSDSTSVGDIAGAGRYLGSSQNSQTHGFLSGGSTGPARLSTIDKFSFANENDSVGHGDLAGIRYGNAGHSSTTDGYSSVGGTAYNGKQHDIHKFSFSSNTTAASHGSVGMSVYMSGGHQY